MSTGSPRLSYEIEFQGISLENDITAIHFHILGSDASGPTPSRPNGPHVLNVFRAPRQDDADLVVDFSTNSLSGIWDDSDENFGGDPIRNSSDSIALSDALADLQAGNLYIQVHSNAFPAPNTGEVRGSIVAVPEPSSTLLMILSTAALLIRRRKN